MRRIFEIVDKQRRMHMCRPKPLHRISEKRFSRLDCCLTQPTVVNTGVTGQWTVTVKRILQTVQSRLGVA